jgi:hypothetical protein
MCHEGQSLSGARKRIDIRPVGSSLGVFAGPAMMSAAPAQAPWPPFWRLPSWIEGPSWGSLDRNVVRLWRAELRYLQEHRRRRRRATLEARRQSDGYTSNEDSDNAGGSASEAEARSDPSGACSRR